MDTPAAEMDRFDTPDDSGESFASDLGETCPLGELHETVAGLFDRDFEPGSRDVVRLYDVATGARTVEVVRAQACRFELKLDDDEKVWLYGPNGNHRNPSLLPATPSTKGRRVFMPEGEDRDRYANRISDLIAMSTTVRPETRVSRFLGKLSRPLQRSSDSDEPAVLVS